VLPVAAFGWFVIIAPAVVSFAIAAGAAMAWCAWLEKHPDAPEDAVQSTQDGACEPIVRRGLSGRVCAGWWGPRVVRRRGYSAFLRDFSGTSWSLFRRERLSWKYGDQSVMGTHVVTVDRVFTPTGVPNVAGNEVASCTVGRLGADRRTHSRAHRTATTCVIARAEPRRRTKAQQAPGQEIH
jgi:hypothetical protein